MNTAKLRQAEGKKPLFRSGFDNKKMPGVPDIFRFYVYFIPRASTAPHYMTRAA